VKILFFLFTLGLGQIVQAGISFESSWNNKFQKELIVSCDENELFCKRLCEDNIRCILPEGPCRDCIGTSLMITNFLSEIGRTIVNSNVLSDKEEFLNFLMSGKFVTFVPNDVYNVIDASGSLSAMRKFEKLCPKDSLDQIVFFNVNPHTRKVIGPKSVYCVLEDSSSMFDLRTTPDVIINFIMTGPAHD
jgi:hypothetical protein